MGKFTPKKYVKQVYPALTVPVDHLFSAPQYAISVERVIRFLAKPYLEHSDGSWERTGRHGVITEQFNLAMPTVAAHIAEIELCNGIHDRAFGMMSDEKIKEVLKKYLDTHIYVYRHDGNRWVKEIKAGHSLSTKRDVALYLVQWAGGEHIVLNAIQVHLYLRLERDCKQNHAEYRISTL